MVLCLALMTGQTAQGKSARITIPNHKHLTLQQTIKWQHRIIRHDRWVIRTRHSHRIEVVKWHRAQLKWTTRELRQSQHLLSLRQSQYSLLVTLSGVCGSCWDKVADCESSSWSEVTGNGFYWGLQWVPSTWDNAARPFGYPNWLWFINHKSAPSREMQIMAASKLSLSNWPVCGARYND